jgi:acetyl/propionyl-CoA carboxylase alpha subunit
MISKVLIANRGEIAVRIIKTCNQLGIKTVAVFSEADRYAMHTRLADESVFIGASEAHSSYLNQEALLTAIKTTGADAVHPGYGFLSENASFAELLEKNGITFIAPPSSVIAAMGDKVAAKILAKQASVPLVPGTENALEGKELENEIATFTKTHGFPILLKAAAGGGGRGIRVVSEKSQIASLAESASREAKTFFSDGRVFIEKLVQNARHIEVQLFGDNHGNVRALGLRDCSMQRNHQKVIEEAPAFGLSKELTDELLAASERLGEASGYRGAGTVEFLLDSSGQFYFLEVNSRLQVEHPVTEMVTGLDLVALQIAVANGECLTDHLPKMILPNGHAIELRICAEMPEHGFRAGTGRIRAMRLPESLSPHHKVRSDFGFEHGDTVSHYYDSMLGKLIVHAPSRGEAIASAKIALGELLLVGVPTNSWYLQHLMASSCFAEGSHTITSADALHNQNEGVLPESFRLACRVVEAWDERFGACRLWATQLRSATKTMWQVNGLEIETQPCSQEDIQFVSSSVDTAGICRTSLKISNAIHECYLYESIDGYWLTSTAGCFQVRKLFPTLRKFSNDSDAGQLVIEAPLPGAILKVFVESNSIVEAGQVLCTLESMKMEHQIMAHRSGKISHVLVAVGSVVEAGTVLFNLS